MRERDKLMTIGSVEIPDATYLDVSIRLTLYQCTGECSRLTQSAFLSCCLEP